MLNYRWLVLAGFAVFLVACAREPVEVLEPKSTEEVQADIEKEVAQLKDQVPKVIEPGITCRSVRAGQRTVIYDIEVAANVVKAIKDQKERVEDVIADKVRNNKRMSVAQAENIRRHYKFFDESKNLLGELTVHGS